MRFGILLLFLAGGCGVPTQRPTAITAPVSPPVSSVEPQAAPSSTWATSSRSPWPLGASDAVTAACGQGDAALMRVARAMLEGDDTSGDRAVALLRANGEPHVRPRVITAKGDRARIAAELALLRRPNTRCGVATNEERVLAVAIDAIADLDPLPTRARTGEWLTFSATLPPNTKNAKLIVLGPRGAPRTVPTSSTSRSKTRARFALDQPGAFVVQLMGELDDGAGPQPLLEARVFADVAPTTKTDADPAPGEEAPSLEGMVAKLRASESLSPLKRDDRLDALAFAHLNEMIARRTIAHDVGDGDLRERFERESLAAASIGENVAKARSLGLAHRALHASPSHRMNLLRADYTHMGLATGVDDLGNVYVCEVFAAGLR